MLSFRVLRRATTLMAHTTLCSMRLQHALNALSPADPRREQERAARTRAWARDLLDTFGIRSDVEGSFPESPFLLVANHRSAIDVGMLLAHANVSLVARDDLANWPVVGPAARSVGTVFVERKASASGAATLRTLVDALRAGRSMAIFPEGYTFEGDDVRTFQPGIALASFMSKVPIVPVGLAYELGSPTAFVDMSFAEHVARVANAEGAKVSMCVGAPIPPPTRDTRASHTDEVRTEVQRLVRRARLRVDSDWP